MNNLSENNYAKSNKPNSVMKNSASIGKNAPQSGGVKRQVAIKTWISDITLGKYVKVDGEWEPNYILTPRGVKVTRANIIGIVLSEPEEAPGQFFFTIDDGSAKVAVRGFDASIKKRLSIGDIVLIIGRPREFNNEMYIMPEIISKIENKKWLEYRKLELEELYKNMPIIKVDKFLENNNNSMNNNNSKTRYVPKLEADEEIIEDKDSGYFPLPENKTAEKTQGQNPIDLMLDIIRKLDSGNGADIEDAIIESKLNRVKADAIVNNLMLNGEIFEIRPGKLKVM